MNAQITRFYFLSVIVGLGMMLAGRAGAQAVDTPISNLGQPNYSSMPVAASFEQAASFTTGSTSTYLVNVSVRLMTLANSTPFILTLCSNLGGSPGGTLATLSGNSYPTTLGNYSYSNSTPVVLSANTTYWLVASCPGLPPNFYVWYDDDTTNLDPGSVWTLGASESYSDSWSVISGVYFQFSVTVSNINLPALSLFQPVVLTYQAPSGVPFILQQSPTLPGNNWVTATNAIQMATVNTNQAVFIVPPSGQQMFFRLSLQ